MDKLRRKLREANERTTPKPKPRATEAPETRSKASKSSSKPAELPKAPSSQENKEESSGEDVIIDADTGMELELEPIITSQEELDMITAMEQVEDRHIPKVVIPDDNKVSIWFRRPILKLAQELEGLYHGKGMNEGRIELITQQKEEAKFPPSFSVRTILSVSEEFQQRLERKELELIEGFNKQRLELLVKFRKAEITQLNVKVDEVKEQMDNVFHNDHAKWADNCAVAKLMAIPSTWKAWLESKKSEAQLNGAFKANEWKEMKLAQAKNREAKMLLAQANSNNTIETLGDPRYKDFRAIRPRKISKGGRGAGQGKGRGRGITKPRRN